MMFLFVPGNQIEKAVGQKELQISMYSSSLLGVSNDASSKSEEFSLNDIEVFVDQNWFKRTHVENVLGLVHIYRSTEN